MIGLLPGKVLFFLAGGAAGAGAPWLDVAGAAAFATMPGSAAASCCCCDMSGFIWSCWSPSLIPKNAAASAADEFDAITSFSVLAPQTTRRKLFRFGLFPWFGSAPFLSSSSPFLLGWNKQSILPCEISQFRTEAATRKHYTCTACEQVGNHGRKIWKILVPRGKLRKRTTTKEAAETERRGREQMKRPKIPLASDGYTYLICMRLESIWNNKQIDK